MVKWRSAGQKLKLRLAELSSMLRQRPAELRTVLRLASLNPVVRPAGLKLVVRLAGLSLVVKQMSAELNLVMKWNCAGEKAGRDEAGAEASWTGAEVDWSKSCCD